MTDGLRLDVRYVSVGRDNANEIESRGAACERGPRAGGLTVYATIRRYAGSDLAAKLRNRASDVTEEMGGVAGVRAYYLIQAGGDSISVTISDDAAGGQASNEAAARWLSENMPDIGAPAPEVSAGEVVVSL